jgi:hypothetical protein
MKKYISFILLIIILFISNGYHLYFSYVQHSIQQEIKHKIRKGLSEKELTQIVISSNNENEITWIKKNKEFRYKGFMYDIVKIKIKNNKKYYYCINDLKEKNLIANYTRHNRRRKNILLRLRKVLSNKYFPEYFSVNIKTNTADIYFAEYQQLYDSVYLETLSPPPNV